MEYLINILIVCFAAFSQAFSLVEIPIKVVDENGEKFLNSPIMIGISEDASYDVDSALGELELFPGKPPGEIKMCVLKIEEVDENNGLKLWSNKDMRPQTNEGKQLQKYHILLYYFQKELTMSFDFDENDVDSIKITDLDDGVFLNEDITSSKQFFYNNKNLVSVEFYIHVWYNLTPKSVSDNFMDEIIKYNNSNLISTMFLSEIKIYDVNGKPIYQNIARVKELDLSPLSSGIYFLRARVENRMINKIIIISR